MTPPPSILQDPRHLPQGAGGLFAPQGKKRPRPARWGRGRSLCSCFGGCCRANSGGSGRSDLGGSSLRRCSLAGDLRSSHRRCSLACSLGGSAVHVSYPAANKVYFYVDKDFVAPIITMLYAQVNKIPNTGMDKEDLAQFMILKSVVNQLTTIMEKTTKFEAGIELIK